MDSLIKDNLYPPIQFKINLSIFNLSQTSKKYFKQPVMTPTFKISAGSWFSFSVRVWPLWIHIWNLAEISGCRECLRGYASSGISSKVARVSLSSTSCGSPRRPLRDLLFRCFRLKRCMIC